MTIDADRPPDDIDAIHAQLDRYFNGFFPNVWISRDDVKKYIADALRIYRLRVQDNRKDGALSNFSTVTMPSENHGSLEFWQEVRPDPAIDGTTYVQVWAARAGGSLGYGETPTLAIVSALEGAAMAREDTDTRRVEYNFSLTGQGADLPEGFWASLSHNMTFSSAKILREETGLSMKSARKIVDRMMEPKAPVFPGTVSRSYVAAEAPNGTVIRIKGGLDDGRPAGFVFEKLGDPGPPWCTTGDEGEYSDSFVQATIDKHGYDLLYVPGGRA